MNKAPRGARIRGAGGEESSGRSDADLDRLVGTWVEDPEFDEAIRAQDLVDEVLWR